MNNRVYGYLRASTKDQNAERAKDALDAFADSHSVKVSKYFIENVSGASLKRPQLFELLSTCESGDVLLIEQVDRLTRLSESDWEELKGIINDRGVVIVSLDLPTSHSIFTTTSTDAFTGSIIKAVNSMLLDVLAATSRKDYLDRFRRQQEGIKDARAKGKYRGRPVDRELHQRIETMLRSGISYSEITKALECSRATVAKVSKQIREEKAADCT